VLAPGGRFLGFVRFEQAFLRLWVVDVASRVARCPLVVPRTTEGSEASRQELHFFGFDSAGDLLYFGVSGMQTAGPYEGQFGWWLGSVPTGGGDPVALAWIPYEREVRTDDSGDHGLMRDGFASGDGSGILINDDEGLSSSTVRVSLPDGRVTECSDGPRWMMGSPEVEYSPDGWWAILNHGGSSPSGILDMRGDRTVTTRPPCGILTGWSPDGKLVVGWDTIQDDLLAAVDGYWAEAAIGFSVYGLDGERLHELPAPGGGERRVRDGVWSPDGQSLAFPVGVVREHWFDPQELWIWNPAAESCVKLLDLPGEADGTRGSGSGRLVVEWVEPTLMRLWYGLKAGDDPTVTWQDVKIDRGTGGFTLVGSQTFAVSNGLRIGSWGESMVVAQGTEEQHVHMLLVGPEGETLLAEVDGYRPLPSYPGFIFAPASSDTEPCVVLLIEEYPGGQEYVDLIPLPR